MTTRLTLLPHDEPDEIDLELRELGAAFTTAEHARIEAAREGPLSETDAELAAARDFFAAHAPPLRVPEISQAAEVVELSRPTPWRYAVVPVLALAAAALLFVSWPSTEPELAGVRSMGGGEPVAAVGLAVEVRVIRDGAVVVGADFLPGDELHLTVHSPRDGYLDVWTRQDDGAISSLVLATPVTAGQTWPLPGAVRLDDYAGEEWLMASVTESPVAPAALQHVDPDGLEAGVWANEATWSLEVTRR